jgi:hypothetical protein
MRARVAWAHDGMSDPTLAAAFQTLPGASFIVNGVTPAKNSALTPPAPSFASPTASRCWPNSTASSPPAPPRTCLVPGDWLDGIGVDRGIAYLRERLASWS